MRQRYLTFARSAATRCRVSLDRRGAAAAQRAAAQCLRAALSGTGGRCPVGDRLIGMIQPRRKRRHGAEAQLSQVGCAGRIVSYRETDDNRYLITLEGICRFRVAEEIVDAERLSPGGLRFRAFRRRSGAEPGQRFPRDRLLAALKDYLARRDMKADWKSVMTRARRIAGQCAGDDVPLRAGRETGAAGSAQLASSGSPPWWRCWKLRAAPAPRP